MNILYVEDNPTDADLLRIVLGRQVPDFTVEVVENVAAAIGRLERFEADHGAAQSMMEALLLDGLSPRYDLVLTDLSLPDGSGYEVLSHVRSRRLPLAVVILTGSSDEQIVSRALRAGADDYIAKRGDYLSILPATLRSALGQYQSGAGRRSRPLKILYADPDLQTVHHSLRELKHLAPHLQIEALATAKQVVERLCSGNTIHPIDILLLDCRLPDMNCTDLVKELRQVCGLDLPIVLTSVVGDEPLAQQAIKLGVSDYLIKSDGYLRHLPWVVETAFYRVEAARDRATLTRNERELRSLADNLPDVVVRLDRDLCVLYVNRTGELETGFSTEEFIGKKALEVLEFDDPEGILMASIKRTFATGLRDLPIELTRSIKTSTRYWVTRVVPENDADGVIQSVLLISRDISHRRRAQAESHARANQQGVVANLGLYALSGQSLAYLFKVAARQIALTLRVDFAEAVEIADGQEKMLLSAGHGWPDGVAEQLMSNGGPDSHAAYVMSADRAVVIDDQSREARFSVDPILIEHAVTSSVSTIIRGRFARYGMVTAHSVESRKFAQSDIDFLQGVANILAAAIERSKGEDQLAHQAHHDVLTGLPNRALMQDRLDLALAQARRNEARLALMYLDLDRFKIVNDSLGHHIGDELLKAVATRLRDCLRDSDTVSRQGGDEFTILLPSIPNTESVAIVARTLLDKFSEPFHLYGQEIFLSTSIGITIFPDDAANANDLIRRADAALYRAKDMGRNTHQFFTPDINALMQERLDLEGGLRSALSRSELRLVYQPEVDPINHRVVALESALRWTHPVLGDVMPDRFIPIAEETGLIHEIGEWIIRAACEQGRVWHLAGFAGLNIAINLSARQFYSNTLADTISRICAKTGFDPACLEFEITESDIMRDAQAVVGQIEDIKALGARISIDDFGTGYSSLSYLKRFNVDSLKIDRSFVRDIPGDLSDAAIAASVIALAHSINLKVVAEGVETKEQLDFLVASGCDVIQGFYYSRPLEAPDVASYLSQHWVG